MTIIRDPRALAKHAGQKITDATALIQAAEDANDAAFRAIEDAATAGRQAGFDYSPQLSPELRAAYRRWLDRPEVDVVGVDPDPLDAIPEFLR